jgi:hypothetical protein
MSGSSFGGRLRAACATAGLAARGMPGAPKGVEGFMLAAGR